MKGRQISEVKLSELEFSGRIDAEYYRPKFLAYESLLKSKDALLLNDVSNFLIGPFGSAFTVDNYTDDKTYRYIRGKDVKPLRLMDVDNVYMPKSDYERLERYALAENDVLVSVVGTLGNAAIVTEKDLPAIFSCKSTVLRSKQTNPKYLLTYINTKYGRELLLRKERGAIQKGLNLDDLKNLPVFLPSDSFQDEIENLFTLSADETKRSKQTHKQAENLLLEAVGLKDFEPTKEKTNIKQFSKSFLATGRLDAEYYQPKFENLRNILMSYKNGYDLLGEIITTKRGSFVSDDLYSDSGIPYIRGGDISSNILEPDKLIHISNTFKVTNETICQKDDIVFALIGSVGTAALIRSDAVGSLISNNLGLITVTNRNYLSEYLHIFLTTSKLGGLLFSQKEMRTTQPKLSDKDIYDFPVPRLGAEKQKQISELIEESFRLKRHSENLLEIAKRAVEIAIEETEETAIKFIEESAR